MILQKLAGMTRYPIKFLSPEGAVDYLEVDGCGLVRIHTWYHAFCQERSTHPGLSLDSETFLQPTSVFRIQRFDVKGALRTEEDFHGVVFEYLCPRSLMDLGERTFQVYWKGKCIASLEDATSMEPPHYPHLLDGASVFSRDSIYGAGLPVDYLNHEVLALAHGLPQPILDFGCGTGVLVAALREGDKECVGLELDRPEIRDHLPSGRVDFVDLYAGSLPLPYEDDVFASVVMSEVLEHLDEPVSVMAEIARICQGTLLVTVPDLSAVPLNHKNEVVPWHLLSIDHVNFFNSQSLKQFLEKWFPGVELYKIGRQITNDTQWWGNLMALARKGD